MAIGLGIEDKGGRKIEMGCYERKSNQECPLKTQLLRASENPPGRYGEVRTPDQSAWGR